MTGRESVERRVRGVGSEKGTGKRVGQGDVSGGETGK